MSFSKISLSPASLGNITSKSIAERPILFIEFTSNDLDSSGRKMKWSITLFIYLIQHMNSIGLYNQLNNGYKCSSLLVQNSKVQSSLTLNRLIFYAINITRDYLFDHIDFASDRC